MLQRILLLITLLRVTYGVLFVLVGADKFFNAICDWTCYFNSSFADILAVPHAVFLQFFGALQVLVGMLFFTRYYKGALYSSLIMLIGIFINLLSMHAPLLVIVHDLNMIVLLMILENLLKYSGTTERTSIMPENVWSIKKSI